MNGVGARITETSSSVDKADVELKSLTDEVEKLSQKSQALQENATLLREADVQVIIVV